MDDLFRDKGLWLDQLTVLHKGRSLVQVNHHIQPGAVLTLMGPSGVGKSTLLSAITGTLPPVFHQSGRAVLDGTDLTGLRPEKRRVGILFQDELLFPHLSVGDNLAFGLAFGQSRAERSPAARRARIETALAEIDLSGFADRDPATLSGGQKARVALMRMLLAAPCALLLDEAFSRLDTTLRAQMRDVVFGLARARALPVLMVTHDPGDAEAAQGTVIQLEHDNS